MLRFIPLILRQVLRHRTRTLLTVSGVAIAMFLFCGVQSLRRAVEDATSATARESTLVVYRQNRFCPFTSRLPEHYQQRIGRIDGVASAVPIKIVVNNCRASLDVVTFRGIPPAQIDALAGKLTVLDGSIAAWKQRSDSALVGEVLARRRNVRAGDSFDAAGVRVTVAAVIRSDEPQNQNVAYVPLDFLQRTSAIGGLGIVTQFNVKLKDPKNAESVAAAIDDEFRSDPEPTTTRPESAFVAQAAKDIIEIVRFTQHLGWACLAAVLALVGNAIVLSVQDRIKEHAVLQTLGYRPSLIARLIVSEGVLLSVFGGLIGTLAAAALVRLSNLSLTVEGVSMTVSSDPWVILIGLAISAALGIVAGLIPAWQASRRSIAACFRAV